MGDWDSSRKYELVRVKVRTTCTLSLNSYTGCCWVGFRPGERRTEVKFLFVTA